MDVRYKFLCDYSRRGVITARYLSSEDMLADLLTKALDATKLAVLRRMVRLGYLDEQLKDGQAIVVYTRSEMAAS